MAEAWIVDAVRTPVGKVGGALSGVRPDDLAALALSRLAERTGVPPAAVEDVVLGCANQAGEDNRNVARMALLLAGWPDSVPGVTVNRLCGSGLEAVVQAARAVAAGDAHAVVAGGVESMTRAPWALPKPEHAFPRGHGTFFDTALGWRFVNPRMAALGHADPLGITAEHVARERGVDRAAQDRFALRSHRLAVAAADAGVFARELVPVEVAGGALTRDEGPRPDTSLEKLAGLRPAFLEGGTVTAGNSSPLSDGAAALLVVSGDFARAHGLRPLARIRASAAAGVPPRVMGLGPVPAGPRALERAGLALRGVPPRVMGMGPVPAGRRALERAGLALREVERIELNEAFAAQVLADLDAWGLDREDPRVNPDGGAIALGHPLGCSGARILTTLVHGLHRAGQALGLAAMCIGVGQGIAMVVERAP